MGDKQNSKMDRSGGKPSENEDVATTMANAFQDLARGEQTATAMENKLSALEERIDSLLNNFEDPGASGENGARDATNDQGKDNAKAH